jgi:hypothetical protein
MIAIRIESKRLAKMFLGLTMVPTLQRGPSSIDVGDVTFGIRRKHLIDGDSIEI